MSTPTKITQKARDLIAGKGSSIAKLKIDGNRRRGKLAKGSLALLEGRLSFRAEIAYRLLVKAWGCKGKPTGRILRALVGGSLEPRDVVRGVAQFPQPHGGGKAALVLEKAVWMAQAERLELARRRATRQALRRTAAERQTGQVETAADQE